MKFLVIGASGFIGRHILHRLVAAGHAALGTQTASKDPKLIEFDLLRDRIAPCLPADFVRNEARGFAVICAALSQIDRCLRERDVSYAINVTHTIQLIQDVKAMGLQPVFLSTGSVYDGSIGYYDEAPLHCPINEYGRHKAAVETFIRDHVPSAVVLRLDKVVGDDPRENHLFSEWYSALAQNQPLVCIEGQLFSPTLVDDIGRALELTCERGLLGVYNVANPEFFSRDELARQFVLALGKKREVACKPQSFFNFCDPRGLKSYLDSTKFITTTGFRFTSMREVMKNFIAKASDIQPR
jgi:dTDP-4-dehydrorhamnose reductase